MNWLERLIDSRGLERVMSLVVWVVISVLLIGVW